MQALSIAAAGMSNALNRFETSARRTASGSLDTLPQDAVEQMEAKTAFSANVAVARTADEMIGALLDIKA
jgi:hypothetical protein